MRSKNRRISKNNESKTTEKEMIGIWYEKIQQGEKEKENKEAKEIDNKKKE